MTVFYWMAAFYLLLAVLSLIDHILLQFGLAPGLTNLYWLRLHLLTIGVLAQAVLGTLPSLLATRLNIKRPSPTTLWTIFGLFNVGLVLLAVGQVLGVIWLSSLLLPWSLTGPVVGIAYLFVIAAILPYLRTLARALLQIPKMAELAGRAAERTTV